MIFISSASRQSSPISTSSPRNSSPPNCHSAANARTHERPPSRRGHLICPANFGRLLERAGVATQSSAYASERPPEHLLNGSLMEVWTSMRCSWRIRRVEVHIACVEESEDQGMDGIVGVLGSVSEVSLGPCLREGEECRTSPDPVLEVERT